MGKDRMPRFGEVPHRRNSARRLTRLVPLTLLLPALAFASCSQETPPDLDATVSAAVQATVTAEKPLRVTVDGSVDATIAAQAATPPPTPVLPTPTTRPDADLHTGPPAMPSPTPTTVPTATFTPTATPTPTPTAVPTPTPTPIPSIAEYSQLIQMPTTPPPAAVKTGEMVYRCSGTSFTHGGTS